MTPYLTASYYSYATGSFPTTTVLVFELSILITRIGISRSTFARTTIPRYNSMESFFIFVVRVTKCWILVKIALLYPEYKYNRF